MLRTAVVQARAWLDAGIDTAVAVNLSARSLHDGAISNEVARLLAEFALPPNRLQLEITESSIMADPARAKRVLEDLDAMGLHLSIDDFGTGYSSLSYLQDLPVREVKIDMSFVMNVLENPRDRVIVRSTIDLAHHLGLRSTAEGSRECRSAGVAAASRLRSGSGLSHRSTDVRAGHHDVAQRCRPSSLLVDR